MKIKKIGNSVNRSLGGDVLVFLILIIVGAFMLLPFVYAIVQSFKPLEEIFVYPPKFFVRNPTLENYQTLSQITDSLWIPFSKYIFNSVIVTVAGTVLNIAFCSMAAFALAKYPFPGHKWMFKLVVSALLFTGSVTQLPKYIILSKLNMINTLWSIILPAAGAPLGLFLMKNFMTQIPDSIIEAAKIDGAGIFYTFRKICMPLVRPAELTLIIFAFQDMWNATGSTYIYEERWKLLPAILSDVVSSGLARAGASSASAVLMMIPPCLLFILLQSRIVETMSFSGIKG